MPRVLNRKTDKIPEDSVYIGRPSKWGNPYYLKRGRDRDHAVNLYRKWLLTNEELMADLEELRGKDLVCWCAPERCHGDVLLEMANKKAKKEK